MTTLTLAPLIIPQDLAFAVLVEPEGNVVAFTPQEYFMGGSTVELSRPDQEDVMYLALLRKGERVAIRGNKHLKASDLHRALENGWEVWLLRVFIHPRQVYVLSDIDVILRGSACEALNDQLAAFQESSPEHLAFLSTYSDVARTALERYFRKE